MKTWLDPTEVEESTDEALTEGASLEDIKIKWGGIKKFAKCVTPMTPGRGDALKAEARETADKVAALEIALAAPDTSSEEMDRLHAQIAALEAD